MYASTRSSKWTCWLFIISTKKLRCEKRADLRPNEKKKKTKERKPIKTTNSRAEMRARTIAHTLTVPVMGEWLNVYYIYWRYFQFAFRFQPFHECSPFFVFFFSSLKVCAHKAPKRKQIWRRAVPWLSDVRFYLHHRIERFYFNLFFSSISWAHRHLRTTEIPYRQRPQL